MHRFLRSIGFTELTELEEQDSLLQDVLIHYDFKKVVTGEDGHRYAELSREYAPDVTILGSGDLFTAMDCVRMMHETGINGVTIARGAIGNPWIFSDLRELAAGRPLPPPPTLAEQRTVIEEHFALAVELYGENRAAFNMKKFCIKYAQRHPEFESVREAFIRFHTREQLTAVLAHPEVSGVFIWQFADVRVDESWAHQRPRTRNNKGVVDEYRRPKMAFRAVREKYRV